LKSYFIDDFQDLFEELPDFAKKQAERALTNFLGNTRYPSLDFKCVNKRKSRYSIRINKKGYRALGYLVDGGMYWYWIGGDHNEYERKIRE
jgi:hypothetical protein